MGSKIHEKAKKIPGQKPGDFQLSDKRLQRFRHLISMKNYFTSSKSASCTSSALFA